jgi:23S rRNA (uracil1939-C5)-methyltransferase
MHSGTCGGCQRVSMEYRQQLALKEAHLKDLFAGLITAVPEVVSCAHPFYYRHKVQLPFAFAPNGRIALGCYAADSHTVVDQKECLVQDRDLSQIAWAIRSWATRHRLTVYNEQRHSGFLRHVLLRKGAGTSEILVGIVTSEGRPPGTRSLAASLLEMTAPFLRNSQSHIAGIVQNVNQRATNVVLGGTEYVWWGRPFIHERLGTCRYRVGMSTFFQVNPFQTPVLYDEVLRHIPRGASVLDIYSGVGSIALWISKAASAVLGIEENPASVKAARASAHVNGVRNCRFVAGDANVLVKEYAGQGYTVAVVDPPRKGLDPAALDALRGSSLDRLIYVSCNPATLARDVRLFDPVLRLSSVQGVDMFPHTDHVECVAVLDAR